MTEFDAAVISCVPYKEKKDLWLTELDATAFYPEGGGQPADTGWLYAVSESGDLRTEVVDVKERDGHIYHICDEEITVGTKIHGCIDRERRFDHMQQHSGEHIVSGMICEAFKCDNIGFHMGAELITIDYNAEISMEALLKIEERANSYIWENHECVVLHPTEEELEKISYRSKKELTGDIRIVSFPGADTCACCGTHVRSSAEVGLVKFTGCQKFTRGTRIELVCGKRAFDFLKLNFEQNSEIARCMAAGVGGTAAIYHKQLEEISRLKLRLSVLEAEYFKSVAEKYSDFGDVILFTEEMQPDSLRRLAVMIAEHCGGLCAVFAREASETSLSNVKKSQSSGTNFIQNIDRKNENEVKCNDRYKYAVSYKGQDISGLVSRMNTELSGRGGGRGGFAQGAVCTSEAEIREFFKNADTVSFK